MSGNLIQAELKLAGRLDARFFALLDALQATGSINKAARTAGLSYKGAWLLLETACNLANEPLLETTTGGAGGGGTRLTPAALGLLRAWDDLQAEHRAFLKTQEQRLARHPALQGLLRRMSMKTTARNQFAGTVKAVEVGSVSAQVTIALKNGEEITATMTAAAAQRLKLKKGKEAIALIKASAVVLVTDFAGWQLSARNQLAGTVSRIEHGAVSSLVVLTLPGGAAITASVTNEGVEALGLKVGVPAAAVFKASDIARKPLTVVAEHADRGSRAALKMLQDQDREYAYVVSPAQQFLGVVSAESLRSALAGHQGPLGLAHAYLPAVQPIVADEPVSELFGRVASAPFAMPVVQPDGRFGGAISKTTLLKFLDRDTPPVPPSQPALASAQMH